MIGLANVGILRLFGWLKVLKDDALILYYAWKHPGTPSYIRGMLAIMIAYVISPIDFLPDYIPLLGIADDAALIPASILYLNYLLPAAVRTDCQRESMKLKKRAPWLLGLIALLAIGWLALIAAGIRYLLS